MDLAALDRWLTTDPRDDAPECECGAETVAECDCRECPDCGSLTPCTDSPNCPHIDYDPLEVS